MKKILPLIAFVLVFAAACKKNEPVPTPTPTPNSSLQWQTLISGKKVTWTEEWQMDSSGSFTYFYGCGSKSDSIYYHNAADTFFNGYYDFNPLGRTNTHNTSSNNSAVIKFLSSHTFYFDSGTFDPITSSIYYLTDTNFDNKYYVFTNAQGGFPNPDSSFVYQNYTSKLKKGDLDSLELCAKGGRFYLGYRKAKHIISNIFFPKNGVGNVMKTEISNYSTSNSNNEYYDRQLPCGSPLNTNALNYNQYKNWPTSHFDRFRGDTWNPALYNRLYSIGNLN